MQTRQWTNPVAIDMGGTPLGEDSNIASVRVDLKGCPDTTSLCVWTGDGKIGVHCPDFTTQQYNSGPIALQYLHYSACVTRRTFLTFGLKPTGPSGVNSCRVIKRAISRRERLQSQAPEAPYLRMGGPCLVQIGAYPRCLVDISGLLHYESWFGE